MMVFLASLAAIGWAAAAFLAGWRYGEGWRTPPRDRPAAARRPAEAASPEQQEAARRAAKAWENFLRYDGTAQAGD